jgi:CHAT domain-containing protein
LTDEAVHLASAFHVAGYRHVVATPWPVTDRLAMRLTSRTVYTDLARHNDLTRLPGAVHAAVRQFRDRYLRHPFAWAAHIHIGP